MTQKKKFRNTVFGVLGAFTLAATPILAVSCSNDSTTPVYATDRQISTMVDDYNNELYDAAGST